jgi:hypothetical protein
MAEFDLQGLLASFDPTEEQKHAARMAAITQLGLGLLGTRKGDEFLRLGEAGTNAMAGYGHALNDIPRQKMERMAAAGQAMGLQEKVRQFADEDQARKILMGAGAPQSMAGGMGGGPPQGVPFGMGDHSSGMAPPMGPPPMGPAAAPKGLYEQLLAKADALEQGGLPQKAQEYRMLAEKYAPKYKNLETVTGPDGNVRMVQTYENQAPTDTKYLPKPDYKEVGMGDQKMFYDPVLKKEGATFRINQSPDSLATNKLGWANYGLASQRERREAANEGKPQVISGPNGEVYTVDAKRGTGAPVMGPDGQPLSKGDKPLTESQAKATAFVNQMQNASTVLAELDKKGFNGKNTYQQAQIVNAGGQGIPYVPGTGAIQRGISGKDAQTYQQAELQWTEGALRFMTGANAPEPEVIRNAATYFPRPGDSEQVIARKAAARKNMEQSVAMAAGRGTAKLGNDKVVDFNDLPH